MFISKIEISNFRLFGADSAFSIADFNVPDGDTPGSGINVFVGENGSGKTTLLDAISLPLLEYKSDSFSLDDVNDPKQICNSAPCQVTNKGFWQGAFRYSGICDFS